MRFADRIFGGILYGLGLAYALGSLTFFAVGTAYVGHLFWETGSRGPVDFIPGLTLLICCIAGFIRVLHTLFGGGEHTCFPDILLARAFEVSVESMAVCVVTLMLSFAPAIFLQILVGAYDISPIFTALLIASLIVLCAYLAIKWLAGRQEQTAPAPPPIQSDDTKLDALAATARPARGVALDTPPKTETKEIKNVYSGTH